MAKLPDGSWYRIIELSSEQEEPETGQAAFSYFYEGKSLAEARRRMSCRRVWAAASGGDLTAYFDRSRPVARVELRRVRCAGPGYDHDAEVVETLDEWQSATLSVYGSPGAPARPD